MNYSIPTTNQICPIPLLERRSSTAQADPSPQADKRLNEEHRKEEFV